MWGRRDVHAEYTPQCMGKDDTIFNNSNFPRGFNVIIVSRGRLTVMWGRRDRNSDVRRGLVGYHPT